MPHSSQKPNPEPDDHRRDFGASTLIRIFVLHQRLCRGGAVSTKVLAEELEVDARTIRRDLEMMRDRLGAPIDRDAAGGTHFYTRTCDFLPFVKLTPEEAFAVAVATYAFAAAEGASATLASAMEKLMPLIGGVVSFPLGELGQVVSAPPSDGEWRFAELLMHAAFHRRELRVTYQRVTPGAKPKEHVLHPLLLAPLDHCWVLIAREAGKQPIKHFRFSRITAAQATGRTFDPPADFNAKSYLAGSIGRFAGKQDIEVRVAFAAKVAGYARENFKRHASARWTERADGRMELTLRANNFLGIKNKIVGYGEHAEVLSPERLRESVRDSHKTAFAQYE